MTYQDNKSYEIHLDRYSCIVCDLEFSCLNLAFQSETLFATILLLGTGSNIKYYEQMKRLLLTCNSWNCLKVQEQDC